MFFGPKSYITAYYDEKEKREHADCGYNALRHICLEYALKFLEHESHPRFDTVINTADKFAEYITNGNIKNEIPHVVDIVEQDIISKLDIWLTTYLKDSVSKVVENQVESYKGELVKDNAVEVHKWLSNIVESNIEKMVKKYMDEYSKPKTESKEDDKVKEFADKLSATNDAIKSQLGVDENQNGIKEDSPKPRKKTTKKK